MSHEKHLTELIQQTIIHQELAETVKAQAELVPPAPEQIEANNAVFANQPEEPEPLAALIALWGASAMVGELIRPDRDGRDKLLLPNQPTPNSENNTH